MLVCLFVIMVDCLVLHVLLSLSYLWSFALSGLIVGYFLLCFYCYYSLLRCSCLSYLLPDFMILRGLWWYCCDFGYLGVVFLFRCLC